MASEVIHKTKFGKYFAGDSVELLKGSFGRRLHGKVQLILTSPPFSLNSKKRYGNLQGEKYREWFTSLAKTFADLLTEDGSIVLELGNAWLPGRPIQSLLSLEALMGFVNSRKANLRLCQQFVCYNPARLPSPAQWVTIERIRVTDSFTHVWWMAKTDRPKANNRRVLRPYSKSMLSLLEHKRFNSGKRPSQHNISEKSFLKNNKGSIAHNVIELEPYYGEEESRLPVNVLRFANTKSNDFFTRKCREKGLNPHPARMPLELASFFIHFLTGRGDIVLDPFAGSNTTGYCAELLGRKWIAIETLKEYGLQSKIRFSASDLKSAKKSKKRTSRG